MIGNFGNIAMLLLGFGLMTIAAGSGFGIVRVSLRAAIALRRGRTFRSEWYNAHDDRGTLLLLFLLPLACSGIFIGLMVMQLGWDGINV